MPEPASLKQSIEKYAHSLGFEKVGFASATKLDTSETFLQEWIAQGYGADMDYLKREPGLRSDPQKLLPGAKTVIVLGINYFTSTPHSTPSDSSDPAVGQVAKYACGPDYHKTITKRLESLIRYLEMLVPESQSKKFVDSGPLLERAFAQQAGIGFVGKNTCVISKGIGSFLFLASVITTISLEASEPDTRSCGTCRLCLDACPTDALVHPYQLDARKCISYLTIENRGEIPEAFRMKTAGWVYGCDICQDVCPHNTRVPHTELVEFDATNQTVSLAEIFQLTTDEKFNDWVGKRPFTRAKREGLIRNACLVAVQQKRIDLLPLLESLISHDSNQLIQTHARWAQQELLKIN